MNIFLNRPRWGRNERGEGKGALIAGILVVVIAIYFLKLYVPPRIDKAELREYVEERTRAFVVMQINQQQLQEAILAEAQKMSIPLTEKNLEIVDGDTKVLVRVKYDVTQKVIGGKEWTQHYEFESEIPRV